MLTHTLLTVNPQIRNSENLTHLVEKNAGNILDEIPVDKAEAYLELKSKLHQVDVSKDEDFQQLFLQWAGAKGRRMSKARRARMFEFLEQCKEQERFPLREAYRAIYANEVKRFNKRHFRTLTQLASLVDPDYPVFNQKLIDLYRFKMKKGTAQTKHDKFSAFLRFYKYVRESYHEILESKALRAPLLALKVKLQQNDLRLPREKRLDLIMRSTAELQANGGLLRK